MATVVEGDPCAAGSLVLVDREFANGPGDWGSVPGRVIPKTQEMVLDAALFNTALQGKDQG